MWRQNGNKCKKWKVNSSPLHPFPLEKPASNQQSSDGNEGTKIVTGSVKNPASLTKTDLIEMGRLYVELVLECMVLLPYCICWYKRDCIMGRHCRKTCPLYTCQFSPANSWPSSYFWFQRPAARKTKSNILEGKSNQVGEELCIPYILFPTTTVSTLVPHIFLIMLSLVHLFKRLKLPDESNYKPKLPWRYSLLNWQSQTRENESEDSKFSFVCITSCHLPETFTG